MRRTGRSQLRPSLLEWSFLIDYHGRDLLIAFHQYLNSQGARLSRDRLCNELIPALVEEYQGNRGVFGRDEFLDLANGVRSLA